jgi:small subunit ribosomal protein S15
MPRSKELTLEIVTKYGKEAKNTGSTQAQIALLTASINSLTKHFQSHPKDFHSRRGLLKMVGRRRRLLDYLKTREIGIYRTLIAELGIRR